MIDFAITGGCLVRRRFSVCEDERFTKLIDVIRRADVGFAHLEGTIADRGQQGPEVFPAAEAGWTWIRNPSYFPEELRWAGFDIVSHASNYMYGVMYSTWSALNEAGIPYAGTGRSLKESRRPGFLDTPKGRVALVSSSSSTPAWARAADPIRHDPARPGINQLRLIQEIDRGTADQLRGMAQRMGWWMTEIGNDIVISQPGLHNSVQQYRVTTGSACTMVADPEDIEANLEAIRTARQQADFVMFHIHNHEWDPVKGLSHPPQFIRDLAHRCIDAGADIFVAEGAHALLRGIEIYKGKPCFYDPGDLFKDGNSKTRPISEYYWVQGQNEQNGNWEFTTAQSRLHKDRKKVPIPTNPEGGYSTGKVLGVTVPVCRFDDKGTLQSVTIHPARHLKDNQVNSGLPGLETGDKAREIIDWLGELSAPYGTKIAFDNGVGVIRP
jgi:poly-gamma-glutamate synthesis protein (capsule biosynthesis protein)